MDHCWPKHEYLKQNGTMKLCINCKIVGSDTDNYCGKCGNGLQEFEMESNRADPIHAREKLFDGLVELDEKLAWDRLHVSMHKGILDDVNGLATRLQLQELPLGEVPPDQLPDVTGTFFAEIDDPWNVEIRLPNGFVTEAGAGCYITSVTSMRPGIQKLFVSTEASAAKIDDNFGVVSYAVISCPRCETKFLHESGDDDLEFDRDDAEQDCVACGGSGEWVLG
jgi:hypothetical protein